MVENEMFNLVKIAAMVIFSIIFWVILATIAGMVAKVLFFFAKMWWDLL